ncbi:MAG: hypothetical protein V2A53_02570 [bacterium]
MQEGLIGAEVEFLDWVKQIEGYQEELNNLKKKNNDSDNGYNSKAIEDYVYFGEE